MTFPDDEAERDAYILKALAEDRYDVDWTIVPVSFAGRLVEFSVMSDALRIDGVRIATTAALAQRVADRMAWSLPTPRMVDHVFDQATVKVDPKPRPISRASSEVVAHSAAVDTAVAGRAGLIDNAGKWWVLVNSLAIKRGKSCNFGWRVPSVDATGHWRGIPTESDIDSKHRVIQGPGTAHNALHRDYSQTLRLVSNVVRVDGTERSLADVLTDPALCGALSHEGPLLVTRQPGVPIESEDVIKAVAKAPAFDPSKADTLPPAPSVKPAPAPTPKPSPVAITGAGDVPGVAFTQARNFTKGRRAPIRILCLHSAECGETPNAAENLAAWCAGPNAPRASWHFAVDSNSITQSVRTADTAWHAPGINGDGIGVETAARASQDATGWADPYSTAVIERTAGLFALLCKEHGLPIVKLTVEQVRDGKSKGICDHGTVTKAFPDKGSHTDVGPHFPWDRFLALVKAG